VPAEQTWPLKNPLKVLGVAEFLAEESLALSERRREQTA
jgi:hypothetical protein